MLETQPQTPDHVPAGETETPLVTLSDAAVTKLTELTKEETDPNVGLRVYVYSGGCSGYRYGMMLEDQPAEEDVKVVSNGINVYVDPQSTPLLKGSQIDYVDTLMGAGFTVNNPNAVSGCGCGSSFRTAESAGAPGACGHSSPARRRHEGAGPRGSAFVIPCDDAVVIEIPLFPLRSVLCPGVALPLHIFEERYRLMVNRCIERGEPFGVVLLREGREVGPLRGEVAAVGTTAAIRRAGTYPDGRLDILTVGQQRFRLEEVDHTSEPYLVGRVSLLDEPIGPAGEADLRAQQVGRRFLEYLELLQPTDGNGGPEIEIEFEIEIDDEADDASVEYDEVEDAHAEAADAAGAAGPTLDGLLAARQEGQASGEVGGSGAQPEDGEASVHELDAAELSPQQRRELLMAAARRLTGTDDPTALSYVLTALVQVDLGARQALLEAPDTVARLAGLEQLLGRESWFLKQGLRPLIVDAAQPGGHRGQG